MAEIVTLEQLYDLSIRAFEAEQQHLAACIYIVAKAHENMEIGEMYSLLWAYEKGVIKMKEMTDLERNAYVRTAKEGSRK